MTPANRLNVTCNRSSSSSSLCLALSFLSIRNSSSNMASNHNSTTFAAVPFSRGSSKTLRALKKPTISSSKKRKPDFSLSASKIKSRGKRLARGRASPEGPGVKLYKNKSAKPFCSGTLVRSNTVITASHCKPQDQKEKVTVSVDLKNGKSINLSVKSFNTHPKYINPFHDDFDDYDDYDYDDDDTSPDTSSSLSDMLVAEHNDIAVIFTKGRFPENITTARLPKQKKLEQIVSQCSASPFIKFSPPLHQQGAGLVKGDKLPGITSSGKLNPTTCTMLNNNTALALTEMITNHGVINCKGDSGGGLYTQRSTINKPNLIGISSGEIKLDPLSKLNCFTNKFGIYTLLTKEHVQFIKSTDIKEEVDYKPITTRDPKKITLGDFIIPTPKVKHSSKKGKK